MAVIKSGASTDTLTIDATAKAARVTLYDSSGHAIDSHLSLDGTYHAGVAMEQSVFTSTKNSSTANILAGATWTGTSESTLGVSGIQINTYLDKKHTITLYQSMDGSNWDISDSYTHPASYGSARTFQATASYYKVAVKNEAGTDTTAVRIQTCLCPTVEAIPRALTSGGNLRVTACAEWQSTRLTTGLYAVSTFRTLGTASSPQNVFTLENPSASTVNIAIRGLNVATDSTAVLTSVAPLMKLSRTTGLPTGGTALTPVKYQTSYATPTAVPRGGTASDGGVATAITATAGNSMWTQYTDRPHTAVGWFTHPGYNMIPDVGTDLRQIILVPGEAVLIQGIENIAATTHIIVNCSWIEYTSV